MVLHPLEEVAADGAHGGLDGGLDREERDSLAMVALCSPRQVSAAGRSLQGPPVRRNDVSAALIGRFARKTHNPMIPCLPFRRGLRLVCAALALSCVAVAPGAWPPIPSRPTPRSSSGSPTSRPT